MVRKNIKARNKEFGKKITKRGQSKSKKNDSPVSRLGPCVIGIFVFILVGEIVFGILSAMSSAQRFKK